MALFKACPHPGQVLVVQVESRGPEFIAWPASENRPPSAGLFRCPDIVTWLQKLAAAPGCACFTAVVDGTVRTQPIGRIPGLGGSRCRRNPFGGFKDCDGGVTNEMIAAACRPIKLNRTPDTWFCAGLNRRLDCGICFTPSRAEAVTAMGGCHQIRPSPRRFSGWGG
jgi:hypothetical protein